jgi:hypothetical protein
MNVVYIMGKFKFSKSDKISVVFGFHICLLQYSSCYIQHYFSFTVFQLLYTTLFFFYSIPAVIYNIIFLLQYSSCYIQHYLVFIQHSYSWEQVGTHFFYTNHLDVFGMLGRLKHAQLKTPCMVMYCYISLSLWVLHI